MGFYFTFCSNKKEVKRKKQWINDHQKQQQILQFLHGGCHFGRDKTILAYNVVQRNKLVIRNVGSCMAIAYHAIYHVVMT